MNHKIITSKDHSVSPSMKLPPALKSLALAVSLLSLLSAAPKKSLLNNDPDVIYLNEHVDHAVVIA